MISVGLPLIQDITLSYSSSILVWINVLGVSIIATSLPSSVSIVEFISTDLSTVVGDETSYLSMAPYFLLPPYNILPLGFFLSSLWETGGTPGPHYILILLDLMCIMVKLCCGDEYVLSPLRQHRLFLLQIFPCLISWIYGSWHNVSYGTNQAIGFISYECLDARKWMQNLLHFKIVVMVVSYLFPLNEGTILIHGFFIFLVGVQRASCWMAY